MYFEEPGFVCARERCSPYFGQNVNSNRNGCKVIQLNVNRIEQNASAKNGNGNDGVAVAVNIGWINNYPLATGCSEPGLLPFTPSNSVTTQVQRFNLDSKDINVRIDEQGNVFLNGNRIDENGKSR